MKSSDEPRPPRSSTIADFAAAREAAIQSAIEIDAPESEAPAAHDSPSGGLLAIGVFVGCVVFVVGVVASGVAGLLGGTLGLAVAVGALVLLFGRVGTMGRFGVVALGGFLALLAGVLLGIVSYDEMYFGDRSDRELWDAVSLVGFLLVVAGVIVTVAALLGLLVAAVVRLFRRG